MNLEFPPRPNVCHSKSIISIAFLPLTTAPDTAPEVVSSEVLLTAEHYSYLVAAISDRLDTCRETVLPFSRHEMTHSANIQC